MNKQSNENVSERAEQKNIDYNNYKATNGTSGCIFREGKLNI